MGACGIKPNTGEGFGKGERSLFDQFGAGGDADTAGGCRDDWGTGAGDAGIDEALPGTCGSGGGETLKVKKGGNKLNRDPYSLLRWGAGVAKGAKRVK